ncbi:DsbA family protein [Patulibacter sp.]|uniref:DsbA family protein n=1 Tax=Patulibacter sp. TaxID=1912859 RepID=UPI0027246DEB|nr:DsbA family protein [Patulibacter sp.]MDO9409583.1 DsbA family protein [Patulibacter sp.]
MPRVSVVEFTDPACPFAYSAEPVRWRLAWRFGDQLDWTVRMVGLARDAAAQEAKGFDAERNAEILRNFDRFGMPLSTAERREPAGSWDACRLVVAARRDDEDGAVRLLRALRVAGLAEARPIDNPDVLSDACETAGLPPDALLERMRDDATERDFRADCDAARAPGPAALAMDHKLADVEEDWDGASGPSGRRYTCPTFVFELDDEQGTVAEVPGFQPWAAVEAVVANLAPGLERRDWPEDAAEVLRWAPVPLSTQELADLMDVDRDEARERLRTAGGVEHEVGTDAFWSLA